MADVKKIATRESYGNALAELGETAKDLIVFDADLSGATKTAIFAKKFPERFFDFGIAEANMMGAAAGVAATGLYVPFASTFAMFASGRAFEQVRNSIGYPHLNVKIGATHGGVSVGEDGATHQCIEDFATMRSIPGMTVMCPADDTEARAMVFAAYKYKGPVYMRFCRLATPVIYDPNGFSFEIGKGRVVRDGSDVTIIACGLEVNEAIQAADMLSSEGISAAVIDMSTIKPLDEELVVKYAEKTGAIVTAEEANIIGGLGSAVCETVCAKHPVPVERVGVNDTFGHSGKGAELLGIFGLTAPHIVDRAKAAIERK
ncbi:MAG: transketolase family protein [Oscillospiraceae bacterium]|jgi:transketolase